MAIRMIATKDQTYATRRLTAGDDIPNVSGPNARLLEALGRARRVEEGEAQTEVKTEILQGAKEDLRAEYQRVIGKRPFNGWGDDELRKRIAAASGA